MLNALWKMLFLLSNMNKVRQTPLLFCAKDTQNEFHIIIPGI